jgi:hypothetical protein
MVETVKVRPNHYETLGLTPGASSEEIDQAFAREVNLIALRPLGTFARVSAAYEALRDPVRRLAYDASLAPPPRPSHSLIGRLERAPVNDRSEPRGMQPLSPRLEPEVPPASEPIAEPLPAEPLRQSPESGATNGQRSQWSQPPDQYFADQVDWRELEREARADRSIRPDVGGLVVNTAVGGALLLAIVLGAWTGLQSGNDNQQAQDLTTVQLPIPMATTATPGPAPASAPASSSSEQEVDPPEPTRQVAARPEPDRPPLQIDLPDEAPAKSAPADEASESPASELAAEPAAAPAMRTAKLPLPDAVVARTIGRIGYACGQVASTTAMEGEAPGTFKVTCTSGDSYRAAPVNGRYRFRHLGKR